MIANVAGSYSTNSASVQSTSSGSNLDDTFMKLLVAQLQGQDPISPVDPNEMVGQMVSLNQLNQLIQIRQTLQSSLDQVSASSQKGGN